MLKDKKKAIHWVAFFVLLRHHENIRFLRFSLSIFYYLWCDFIEMIKKYD